MVEGGMKCVKYLLFTFNLIFVIAAIALIAVGAYVQIKMTDYDDLFGNSYTGPGILLICVGAFIFIIAFFGCMGALKENYCLTMSFAVLLGVVFILMIAGGIAAYVLRDDVESEVKKVLEDTQQNYVNNTGSRDTWDKLQQEFECCGIMNYSEWKNLNLKTVYPRSCCKEMDDEVKCPKNAPINTTELYKQSCESVVVDWVKSNVAIVGGVGVGLAFIMVVGVLFACCLARAIRKEYEVV